MRRSLQLLLGWIAVGAWITVPVGLRAAPAASGPDEPIRLSATLAAPTTVRLEWQPLPTPVAGYVVEWAAEPRDGYVAIDFLPASAIGYTHADLMPLGRNHYRVSAIRGPASTAVNIELTTQMSDAEYARRYEAPEDFHWAEPKRMRQPGKTTVASIKSEAAAAAPGALKVSLMPVTVSGFKLSWVDHSSDESGFLVEMKRAGDADFRVVAVVDRDINSMGYALEPPTRSAELRVRAYRYGDRSNTVMQMTGAEPAAISGSTAAAGKK